MRRTSSRPAASAGRRSMSASAGIFCTSGRTSRCSARASRPRRRFARTETIWFEGPLIKQPASQQAEDYPQDYAAEIAHRRRCSAGPPLVALLERPGRDAAAAVRRRRIAGGRRGGNRRRSRFPWPSRCRSRSTAASFRARTSTSGRSRPLPARRSPASSTLASWARRWWPSWPPTIRPASCWPKAPAALPSEARLRFVAAARPAATAFTSRDVAAGGLQNYVYRLTVAAEADLKSEGKAGGGELSESEPNETLALAKAASVPATIGGRIQSPGDLDCWSVELKKDQPVVFESQSSRLASPLAIVVTIKDASGKQLAQLDSANAGAGDPSLSFTPPADGKYLVEVSERFARRGGPEFVYRLCRSRRKRPIFASSRPTAWQSTLAPINRSRCSSSGLAVSNRR